MSEKNVDIKKTEETKVNNQSVAENNAEVQENTTIVENIFKDFDVIKEKTQSGFERFVLKLKTYGDYEFSIRASEALYLLVTQFGKENCSVAVENRYSAEKRKNYTVVAMHVGEDVLDFFSSNRADMVIAKMHYEKHANK